MEKLVVVKVTENAEGSANKFTTTFRQSIESDLGDTSRALVFSGDKQFAEQDEIEVDMNQFKVEKTKWIDDDNNERITNRLVPA